MNELLEDLKNEIESCRMSIAGGNNINVDDALNTLKELKEAIKPNTKIGTRNYLRLNVSINK